MVCLLHVPFVTGTHRIRVSRLERDINMRDGTSCSCVIYELVGGPGMHRPGLFICVLLTRTGEVRALQSQVKSLVEGTLP